MMQVIEKSILYLKMLGLEVLRSFMLLKIELKMKIKKVKSILGIIKQLTK